MRNQKIPNFNNRGNYGDRPIDLFVPQMRLRVLAVDRKDQLLVSQLKIENRLPDHADNRIGVLCANPMFSNQPGDSSIERAAIDVRKTKPLGELARNGAFP